MAFSRFFLATVVVLAFLGIASASFAEPEPTPAPEPFFEDDSIKRIQVTISCVKNNNFNEWNPIQGATIEVRCINYFFNPPDIFTVSSEPTSEKGYVYMDLKRYVPPRFNIKRDCKAFLNEAAPENDCNKPTDTNNGKSGASLDKQPQVLKDGTRVISVGPFYFKPKDEM